MLTFIHRFFTALILSILPVCAFASGTYDVSLTDGMYRIHTLNGQAPVIVLKDGQVTGSFGELTDYGCNTTRAGRIEQTISLGQLFSEVVTSEQRENALRQNTYHSNQWSGTNPFALSKVKIVMTSNSDLQLTHTVTTFLVNSPSNGTTICSRDHYYEGSRIDDV